MNEIGEIAIEPPQASHRRRRRPVLVAAVAVLVLAGLGGGAVLTGRVPLPWQAAPAATAAAPAPPPVSVAVTERRDVTLWREFSGRVEAVGRVEVRPRAAGAILGVPFREGALVRRGDLLVTIDPAPYAAAVQRAEAQVATAEAQLLLAGREQARAQQLVQSSAGTQRDLDQRASAFQAAGAALRSAQAQLTLARLDLGYTEVRAPIDGRVGRIEVTPGNLVPAGPGAPVLTTLVSVDPIYASFEADEQTVEHALAGLPPGAGIDRIPVEIGTMASGGTPFRGRLQFVDNVVDARSGTIRLRARLDNPDGRLLPGQFARIRLGQPRPEPVLAVAEQAIGTDQDRRYVLVVDAANRVAYRPVRLGGTADGLRIVTEGLEPGERIVVNGLQRVRPGAVVAPRPVAMTAATEAPGMLAAR
ncbi:efflux RND transporter periplasmic adaptor subunit [Roseomonas sp. NAR14]|uniref:Efflux RND transporter periplasmic adaptor subunit n=1 Tax=Roseomonas acroporae TaxID=2937791 RepID=A0A9X1YC83_9PROT|nr:efflux RND transporter periplasmic adaptor subunit [Roseomonas acroporae]MCK8787045.1 efflux RND transporter periplasmic adaptor subunit [Roseomonas acroporae]